MKTDKELADHLDAQDRLRRRGYTKKTCHDCKGMGLHVVKGDRNGEDFAATVRCITCDGRGYTWDAPITC